MLNAIKMITKNTIKLIKSLNLKKIRVKENLFLVEGDKNVKESLNSKFEVKKLYATAEFIQSAQQFAHKAEMIIEVTKQEINKASLLKNPQNSFAICSIPEAVTIPSYWGNLSVYLDDIQDPGNLGTIIRICDWFGIENLFCSPNSADLYNPKVIQATMGSYCRVEVFRTEFAPLNEIAKKTKTPILGTFTNGENIYKKILPKRALLVFGNEGNGINPAIENLFDLRLSIPSFNKKQEGAESLNVSVAAAIICAEFNRQGQKI